MHLIIESSNYPIENVVFYPQHDGLINFTWNVPVRGRVDEHPRLLVRDEVHVGVLVVVDGVGCGGGRRLGGGDQVVL